VPTRGQRQEAASCEWEGTAGDGMWRATGRGCDAGAAPGSALQCRGVAGAPSGCVVGERDGEGAAAGRRFPQTGEEAADREGGRQRRGPGALLSFPLGVFFSNFFLPFNPSKANDVA